MGEPHVGNKANMYALIFRKKLGLCPFGYIFTAIWKKIMKIGDLTKSKQLQNLANLDLAI